MFNGAGIIRGSGAFHVWFGLLQNIFLAIVGQCALDALVLIKVKPVIQGYSCNPSARSWLTAP